MTFTKSLLLGSAAVLTAVSAQAADLPSRKAAPVEYVKVCDAYGAGFFYIPGTDTCLKVGGYVRVDYDYRPARDRGLSPTLRNAGDNTTVGFYNRGSVQLDARTQSAWGTIQTVMALRLETAGGIQEKTGTNPSLEAAYVRFAGFTFGQAAQPFAFASGWAWNTPWAQGWPNGVRQLGYTYVFGGGFSATVAATDAKNYNTVSPAGSPSQFERNGIVWVGNLRYDQSWGSAQIMGAYQKGGTAASPTTVIIGDPNNNLLGSNDSGWAVGAGVAINLPMLASGDRLELQAVYADRLLTLIGDGGINTPSAAAYGSNPLGGPGVNFSNGKGYSLLAQLRHYWTPTIRSQLYLSYTAREMHATSNGILTTSRIGGKGNAYGIGHALIWSPVRNFDLGVEVTYLRASWNQTAVRTVGAYSAFNGSLKEDNFIGKVRVQRNF